jgi:multifunctional beta-oxidation protein
MADMTT